MNHNIPILSMLFLSLMACNQKEELAARRKAWTPPPYKATRGTLYKYIKNVKSASEGCVTDE